MKNIHKPEVTQPAHAQPLPWQSPKSSDEDPECPSKLQAIFDSPAYVPAIEYIDFLDGDDTRGLRLQFYYLKPDRLLKQHGVQQTIVVFGGTHIND